MSIAPANRRQFTVNSLVETASPEAPVTVMTLALTTAVDGTVAITLVLVVWFEMGASAPR
jgi:hypothetical protein